VVTRRRCVRGHGADKVCDFCKERGNDPKNHHTKFCLSKAYHDRMVSAGKDPKDIVIPPVATLHKENAQLRVQKQLAWGMASGGASSSSGGASGASPGHRTRSHDNASMAHFSSNNTEDSDYSRTTAPSAQAQASANHSKVSAASVSQTELPRSTSPKPEASVARARSL
jgi:hypothetical protein